VEIAVRVARLLTSLMIAGVALLATGIVLPVTPAGATVRSPGPDYNTSDYRYTDKPPAAAAAARIFSVYIVDDEFDAAERERIGLALQQWNHVLNGYVRFDIYSLSGAPSAETLTQLYRSGAWIVTKVDSYHDIARDPKKLAVTSGIKNRNGGFVYVIGDRFGRPDLTAVMLHELGHVLGAVHDENGHLMRASYNHYGFVCIDHNAVALVAAAQRLPLNQLNWCFGPGLNDGRPHDP
jgi:hypothetical protein